MQANFLIGIVYGLMVNNDRAALKHFSECVDREPRNVGALNNLAISQLFCRQFTSAAQTWRRAAEISPETPELAQNIGSMLSAMDGRSARLPRREMEALSDAYTKLLLEEHHERPNVRKFVYLPPEGISLGSGKESKRSILMGSGSGFVVAPGMIVTNEHVVEDADSVLIMDPRDHDTELPATVVAVDKERDVAVVRCQSLTAPALTVCTCLPPRGADIMVLGFPLGTALVANLKSTARRDGRPARRHQRTRLPLRRYHQPW